MLQRLLIVFTEVKAFNTPENLRQILDKQIVSSNRKYAVI